MSTEYFPIRELTPYHKAWTLKARVTSKSAVRTFNRGTSSGQVFSVDLIDKEGGEIRCSFFNEAVTKYEKMLEQGKCYTFNKGSMRVADKRYNQTNHEYEIQFNADAKIEAAEDDSAITTDVTFNFTDIRTLNSRPLPANIDLIGIITSVEDERSGNTRDGRTFSKYAINVSDETEMTLNVSLFGDMAKKYPHSDMKVGQVVALKGIVVKEWQGKTGVLNDNGALKLAPTTGVPGERAQALEKWWIGGGSGKSFKTLQDAAAQVGVIAGQQIRPCSVEELVTDVEINAQLEKSYFSQLYVRLARVITQKKDEKIALMYDSCPEQMNRDGRQATCNKKVISGQCPIHGAVQPKKRWIARAIFQDHTDQSYLQAFDTEFSAISGKTAEEAAVMSEADMDKWVESLEWQEQMKLTCKTTSQIYEGQARPKTIVVRVEQVNFVERGQELLKEIKQMTSAAGA